MSKVFKTIRNRELTSCERTGARTTNISTINSESVRSFLILSEARWQDAMHKLMINISTSIIQMR